jgi:hypothetical protein
MSPAETLVRSLNPNAVIGEENGRVVSIEDVKDPDGRIYRIEYHASPDGRRAIAWCRFNPWGSGGTSAAGTNYFVSHVAPDGFLCLGNHSERELANSPFDLEFTIKRARYWCTAFSVFMESGTFPNP